jgi:N-acetylglucosaminyldiphosphoundecaprenol N-acetyl-beta-D-mannosaminyltransferase
MSRNRERIDILGVPVDSINMSDAVAAIEEWVEQRRPPRYVCIRDAHGVIKARNDPVLRNVHIQADLVTPDGMPLVWLSRWRGSTRIERVYGPDLMRAISARSTERGYRHFYFGGKPSVADKLAEKLTAAYPGLNVVGTYCPPFRTLTAHEDAEVIAKINEARPDIVWVGLGTPKQEYWMANHVDLVNASVLIGVGAAFDFLAGTKKQAPAWMQRSGLEWLFRLCAEPHRLWGRYAHVVPLFIILAVGDLMRRGVRSARIALSP